MLLSPESVPFPFSQPCCSLCRAQSLSALLPLAALRPSPGHKVSLDGGGWTLGAVQKAAVQILPPLEGDTRIQGGC